MLFEAIALACAALFAGAATYISVAEHPARLECAPAAALHAVRTISSVVAFGFMLVHVVGWV